MCDYNFSKYKHCQDVNEIGKQYNDQICNKPFLDFKRLNKKFQK